MAEHSPLPFKQIESRFDDERKQLIVDATGIYVGKLQYDPDRDSANAAFIVRAVNAHQDLVDACRTLLDACEGIEEAYEEESVEYQIAHKAAERGRKALEKAETTHA